MTAAVDIKALLAGALAARTFEHTTSNGWRFTMVRPSELALTEALMNPEANERPLKFQVDQLRSAITGWQGPVARDIAPAAPDEVASLPLPFDAALFEPLFEDRVDLLQELGAALRDRITSTRVAREEAGKNSPSSPGSAPS